MPCRQGQCYWRTACVLGGNPWRGRELQSKMTQLQILVIPMTLITAPWPIGNRPLDLLQRRRVQYGEIGLCFLDTLGGGLLEPRARLRRV